MKFLSSERIALVAVLLKLHVKLAPGWALIQVNFDPIQEIGPKNRGWALFLETTVLSIAFNCLKFIQIHT